MMTLHSYRKEYFGYIVTFKNGKIGLYNAEIAPLLKEEKVTYDMCQPFKLKKLTVEDNFHLRSPLIVWLELTRECNLRCKHCFVSADNPLKNELSLNETYNILDQLKKLNVFCIVFSGGEPLLNKNFLPIIHYANKLNFITALVTNGTLLNEEIIRKLPKKNFRLTISIDGLNSHTELRGNVKSESLLKKLLLLKHYNIACNVSTTVTKDNIFDLEELFLWLMNNGVSFRTIPFIPTGRGAINNYLQLDESCVDLAAKLWKMELQHEYNNLSNRDLTFSTFFDLAFDLVYMTRRCKGGKSICYITANGDVYPCSTCVGTNMFSVGNIKQSSFDYIWDNSFADFRQITWKSFEVCNDCVFSGKRYFCTCRCPPLGQLYQKNMFACAATPFDTASLKLRTDILEDMEL